MNVGVSIGTATSHRLQKAVMLYGLSTKLINFATVHDVVNSQSEEPPVLGPARLLSVEFVQELIKGLNGARSVEILPENVLVRTDTVTAWWTPAQTRTLFFHPDSSLKHVDGKRFAVPPLLWKVVNNHLSLRALIRVSKQRPRPEDFVALAPFWNVYDNGSVCHGSMRAPDHNRIECVDQWMNAFFKSNFTHTIKDTICRHPGGSVGLWEAMVDRREFPIRYLRILEPHQTVKEFLCGYS